MRRIANIFICLFLFCSFIPAISQNLVWVETELFENKGGWISESQFIDQMGSPYLLAHGLGEPVANAETTVGFEEPGTYHFWVRTKDWVPTRTHAGPGKFQVLINDMPVGGVFGVDKIKHWHWVYGGTVSIKEPEVKLSLQDMTGFDGRCDVICFSTWKIDLPDDLKTLEEIRKKELNIAAPKYNDHYDLVVVGGGVAGVAAAVQAARMGVKVALIQNRPVLGGNSSSEVKVSMDGSTFKNKYPAIGRIVREMDNHEAGVGGASHLYRDQTKSDIVENEENISLFVNMHVKDVEMRDEKISKVIVMDILTLEEYSLSGDLFADCTGDATVGILAGADHRYGRESKSETGEPSAPEITDNLVMGSSNQWGTIEEDTISLFPVQPWMFDFTEDYHFPITNSRWNWESGFGNLHTVDHAEEIRDLNFCAIYSNWAFLKTYKVAQFGEHRFSEVQHVTGKRESYRLLGDIILTEDDVRNKVEYPDAVVTTTWGIDLHYPHPENSKRFPGMEFIAYADHKFKQNDVYTFPYRCLYSRNISNLFMAGRNISVTHTALGTVRVQRTTGMMGEVVGTAAYLCKKRNCLPRDVYEHHLDEFIDFVGTMCGERVKAQQAEPHYLKTFEEIDGFVALWDFKEEKGETRYANNGKEYPLRDALSSVERVDEGPLSGYSAHFDGKSYLILDNKDLGELDITSLGVTVIAWVKWAGEQTGFVAGAWNEYEDGGKRQYGLFVSLPYYNGRNQVCGHISKTGKPTPPFPYSIDYSASKQIVPKNEWSCVGFTYDGEYIKSYFNGIFESREEELINNTKGFKGYPNGLRQSKNPYFFPDGIGSNGSDFTVGSVFVHGNMGNFYKGLIGGIAVFARSLSEEEMKKINDIFDDTIHISDIARKIDN